MRKFIAGIEILSSIFILIGSLLGIGFILGAKGSGVEFIPWSWNLFLTTFVIIGFGLINLIAGINLWRNKTSGYILSIINQVIQLISVQAPNFLYLFYAFLGLIISFSKTGVKTMSSVGASYNISLGPQPVTTTFVGINIVALILLILIIIIYRKKLNLKG